MDIDFSIALITQLGSILAALITTAGFAWKYYSEQKKYKSKKTIPKLFKDIDEIYNCLQSVIESTDCKRALILKTENGGGVPKLGNAVYSSVIFERYSQDKKRVKNLWQRQELDQIYVKNMTKLLTEQGGICIIPFEQWKGSVVEDAYKNDNIKVTNLAEVAKKETAYIYISFVFDKEPNELSPNEKNIMRGSISKMRTIFKRQKEFY